MSKQIFAGLAIAIASTMPAQADEWKTWANVATWKVEYSANVCLTFDKYKNGTTLGFGITRGNVFLISFTRPEWNIPEGNYQVGFELDGADVGTFNAHGDGHLVRMTFELNANNVQKIRQAKTLHARFGKQRYGFNLVGTSEMLPELIRCSAALRGSPANPFDGSAGSSYNSDRVIPSPNPFD
ncbi:hypothetical protein [Azospirillum largimobile]